MDGTTGNSNAFLTSLQQLGQYLAQQNQGTGSGLNLGSGGSPTGPAFNLGSGQQQPSKIVTQVHFPTPESSTNQANATPAVSTSPPAPQTETFAPPTGGAQPIPQPGKVTVPEAGGGGGQGGQRGVGGVGGGADLRNTPYDPDPDTPYLQAAGLGGAGGAGGQTPASSAISGITSALSKGLTNAASAIGGVNTMPTPVQSGPFPTINQYTPTLIGRRTQPVATY